GDVGFGRVVVGDRIAGEQRQDRDLGRVQADRAIHADAAGVVEVAETKDAGGDQVQLGVAQAEGGVGAQVDGGRRRAWVEEDDAGGGGVDVDGGAQGDGRPGDRGAAACRGQ